MTTIVTRTGKGSPLTWTEADNNFTNLNTDKVETVSPTTSGTLTHSGDVFLSGSGQRITGDFSNATIANRVMFQTSTVNVSTAVGVIPNGTSSGTSFRLFNNSDPTNAGQGVVLLNASEFRFDSAIAGTGTYLPMTFSTSGLERVRIDTAGNVLVTSPAGLGYGTGAGGVVTQATSKSTAVTLNKPTGQITMNNAALAAGASVTFFCNCSVVGAYDAIQANIVATQYSNYSIKSACDSGHIYFILTNTSAGSLSDAVQIQFAIIKGATS